MSRNPSRKTSVNSSPATSARNSLQHREQEIDSRVAALKQRLHQQEQKSPFAQPPRGNSPENGYGQQPPRNSKKNFNVPPAFSDAERTLGSPQPGSNRYSSAFGAASSKNNNSNAYNLPAAARPPKRRVSQSDFEQRNSSLAAAPKKKKQFGWFEWARMGCPSRKNAADAAAQANAAFERQRLYAEEGRSTYGGVGDERQKSFGGPSPRASSSRTRGKLAPVTPRSGNTPRSPSRY